MELERLFEKWCKKLRITPRNFEENTNGYHFAYREFFESLEITV